MPLCSLVRTTMRQDQTCLTARESLSPSDDDLAKRELLQQPPATHNVLQKEQEKFSC